MDAFDADVLIYAAIPGHPLGRRVLSLLAADPQAPAGTGSTLLLPELLTKPLREGAQEELAALAAMLARLDLRPLDEAGAQLAVDLLRAAKRRRGAQRGDDGRSLARGTVGRAARGRAHAAAPVGAEPPPGGSPPPVAPTPPAAPPPGAPAPRRAFLHHGPARRATT